MWPMLPPAARIHGRKLAHIGEPEDSRMLKWLRKYNTFILVVGGCLLMVAFLLQSVLSDLSRRGLLAGTAFKVGSAKVSQETFDKARLEYKGLSDVLDLTGRPGRQTLQMLQGGDDEKHWYLLAREAEAAGLVGGVRDGQTEFDDLCTFVASQNRLEDVETIKTLAMNRATNARLTRDDVLTAFAKLRGIQRLRAAYRGVPHYSARRLAFDTHASSDAVVADYILVPAERDMAGVPEPTEDEIKAHYEKYKDTPKNGGEFGIGYKLPPRVKLEWLELSRQLISDAVTPDAIEVEKRFQALYPDGKIPDGKTADGERNRIETEVRNGLTDKAMKLAESTIRGELDRSYRKLDRAGEFVRLPADWKTSLLPDLPKIAELVAARLHEQEKIIVPAPKVVVRSAGWIEQNDVSKLDGIGSSLLSRPQSPARAAQIIFGIHELSDAGDFPFQVGVPFSEALENGARNRYFVIVLDARRESAPDSMDEVRADIVTNIKRLAAYQKLKADETGLRNLAASQGLEAVGKPPEGSMQATLTIHKFTVSRSRTILDQTAPSQALDSQSFRDIVIGATA